MEAKEILTQKMEEINAKKIADLFVRIRSLENGMNRVMGEYSEITGQMQGIRKQLEKFSNKCFVCLGHGKITIHSNESKPIERECGRCKGSGILVRLP